MKGNITTKHIPLMTLAGLLLLAVGMFIYLWPYSSRANDAPIYQVLVGLSVTNQVRLPGNEMNLKGP